MDVDLERIRLRAYEIWESEGRNGDPMEHWLRAERELRPGFEGRSDATLDAARPADSAAALDAIGLAAPAAKKRAASSTKAKDPGAGKAPAASKASDAPGPYVAAAAPRPKAVRSAAPRKDS